MKDKTVVITLSDGSIHALKLDLHLPSDIERLPKWILTSDGKFINKYHIVLIEKV